MISNSRGQAVIETIVAAPVVAIVIGVGFYLLYLAFAQSWMTRSSREAAVCLVTSSTLSRCRDRFEETLAVGIPFGETRIEEFRLSAKGSRVQVSLETRPEFLASATPFTKITAKSSIPRRL